VTLPNALNKDSLICFILSNDCLDVSENTNTYPCMPIDALRDKREYSSYHI